MHPHFTDRKPGLPGVTIIQVVSDRRKLTQLSLYTMPASQSPAAPPDAGRTQRCTLGQTERPLRVFPSFPSVIPGVAGRGGLASGGRHSGVWAGNKHSVLDCNLLFGKLTDSSLQKVKPR